MSSAISQLSSQFMSGAIADAGLTFTAGGASDGGRPVSLSAIVNDTSGRFSDTQRRYAKRIQEQQTADALSEAAHQHGSRHKGFSAPRGAGGDVVSLSSAALSLINQTSAQGAPTPTSGVVKPALSFSNTLQIGGFSLSVSASADGSHVTVVNGPDGFHYMDKAWGDGGGWGGGAAPPGYAMSGSTSGNTQIITVSRSVASATTVSASSDAGSVTASVASAQSESVTFAIDFSTGTITAMDTQQSINEASVSQSAPSPRLSLQA